MPTAALRQITAKQDNQALRARLEAEAARVQISYKASVIDFMVMEGIQDFSELDYATRKSFEAYLEGQSGMKHIRHHLLAFDKLKQHALSQEFHILEDGKVARPRYENGILYLPYHPDPKVSAMFRNSTRKNEHVWDFSRNAPERMKRQVFDILHYELENSTSPEGRRVHLLGLRDLYDFCTEQWIEDIISFSPETAAELGLSDHKAWEDYIDRHILTLAKFNGIRVQDLQWVAAHHNEKGHPHIHVVFWNKNQRTMVPFVHPSIPDKIRKQLILDTFAERIKEYCEAKQRAKEHLSAITDEMIDEFEKYMEHLHPQEYRRLREAFGRITDDELGTSPLDSVVGAMKIAPFISRLFALKEKMPKKGRLYYKLLPEDVKAELDAFVAFLKENNEYIRNLVQDYAESKTRLAMLYDTDPAHLKEQKEKAVAEADKLIANKILDAVRAMLRKDREVQSFEYTEARKAYLTEQMICEILMALEQTAMSFDMEYDDRQKAMSTDLSKAARKEWYLRHKDKGMEP